MNILLTGGSGFIGRYLLDYIKGKETIDMNKWFLLTSKPVEGFSNILHKGYTFSADDIKKAGMENVDELLLLGGYVEKPGDDKNRIVRNNFSSVENLIYLLENLPNVPQKIIFCSSVAVYGFNSKIPWDENESVSFYTEDSPVGKNLTRPYALVKLLQERIVSEWAKEHGCGCWILRLGTVFGKNRVFNDFLGICIKEARNLTGGISVYAPPQQMWNYVYAGDIARWLYDSVNKLDEIRTVNLVSAENYSTNEILKIFDDSFPEFSYVIDAERGYTGQHKAFDNSLCREIFGEEESSFVENIRNVVKEW